MIDETGNNKEQDETSVKEIDRHDPEIMKGLEDAPTYKKQGEVVADVAEGGEEIVTKLADGTDETKNIANPGDMIITNPGGEKYIVKKETFEKRYELKEEGDNVYSAKGHCKAIDNPYGTPITMMASWGKMQNGKMDCKLADTYDPETGELGGEPYIIGAEEFDQTYKPE
ncbi:MAG: PGDYG domain-containing protein [bacterium]|nr:PGDYG domain-containing protein [bacterium]